MIALHAPRHIPHRMQAAKFTFHDAHGDRYRLFCAKKGVCGRKSCGTAVASEK
jgi:hypothetical protein